MSMFTDKPDIYIFNGFGRLDALKEIVKDNANIINIGSIDNESIAKTNIKIFFSNKSCIQAYKVKDMFEQLGFATFITDQLTITTTDNKIIKLPKDRIIMRLNDNSSTSGGLSDNLPEEVLR